MATGFDLFDGLVVFAVSLLIGGAAIHVAATRVVDRGNAGGLTFDHAVVTALLGAVAWAAAVVVLAALELLGVGSVSALGVP